MGVKLGLTALAIIIFIPVLIGAICQGLVNVVFGSSPNSSAITISCVSAVGAPDNVDGYSGEQMTNAATIVTVGKGMGVPEQGWVVAVAAAMQESGLHNDNFGDRDSLGLFQERPSQGWGTPTQILSPTYAATAFYQHLLAVPGWQSMSIDQAAQAVERSAFPNAYAQHVSAALSVVGAVEDATCTASTRPAGPAGGGSPTSTAADSGDCAHVSTPNPVAMVAVRFACAQIGKPYVWGGNGNPGFDCSGLTHAAYAAAGIDLPRTAQTQYNARPLLAPGTPLQPGDLVFFGVPSKIHHVGISLGGTLLVDAPQTGQKVRVQDLSEFSDYAGADRPAL
jgi:cell wall-associated NlpC family hydrolase